MRPVTRRPRSSRWAACAFAGCAALIAPSTARALDCEEEDALTMAAVDLVVEPGAPGASQLQQAIERAGSDLPAARALRTTPDDERGIRRFLERQRERADAPLVCGEASTGDARLIIVAVRAGTLTERANTLSIELVSAFRDPHVVVRDAAGELHRLAPTREGNGRVVRIPEHLPRPLQVQMVATGPDGPRPVAQRVLGGDGGNVTALGSDADGDDDLPTRVAALRSLARVRDLRENRLLQQEAEEHATRVCRERRVRHGGADANPEVRLRERGVQARVVGETVARARSLRGALRALSASPSHRMTLVDRRFTDVGYGVAVDSGHTCVVALFAAWPRYVAH